MGGMPFATRAEVRTLADLNRSLAPKGYLVSQQPQVLHVVTAAAELPEVTAPVGPSVIDMAMPEMRAAAGPFNRHHPWLWSGDWDYAFKARFDFVVHAPLSERHADHPLFAVEFDGPSHRESPARERDWRKNRLCMASGLPLVRIDQASLYRRENLSMIQWLAELWTAWRKEMPGLLADRDAWVARMTDEEFEEARWLPDMDVTFLFGLSHPYPPLASMVGRLSRRHRLSWVGLGSANAMIDAPRWRASDLGPFPALDHDDPLVARWQDDVRLNGPGVTDHKLVAFAEVLGAYPIGPESYSREPGVLLAALSQGRLPVLMAGPFGRASGMVAGAMAEMNLARELEVYLHHHDN
jgi:hypothetical protein